MLLSWIEWYNTPGQSPPKRLRRKERKKERKKKERKKCPTWYRPRGGICGHGLWNGLGVKKSKDLPHLYIWAARKGDLLHFCPRYKLVNAHNISHFSTEQLHVACLKRTGHYMYILIFRLYKVLKVFLTQVKESLSFIRRSLNIRGIHIIDDEKVYSQIYFRGWKRGPFRTHVCTYLHIGT